MKKILSILVVLFVAAGAYAQSLVSGSSSKTLQLLEADGSFLLKAFYDLATVKGVDCKVLIITDAFSGKKTGYILTKNDTSQSMKLLDAESLELLKKEEMVKARDLIADNVTER